MPGFVKHFPDASAAQEARRRSIALAASLPTPVVLSSNEQSLVFQRIEGKTGRALAEGDLAQLLSVVARMHSVSLPGLPKFDPFLRVRPRATLPTRLPVRDILAEPVPRGRATLHGDLHVGQFIHGSDGTMWVVDLDDMALGPPEADLANFTAHLATSLPERSTPDWSDRVCQAWAGIGQFLDHNSFACFLRFALLRRHLKLREAGRYDFEDEILSYLRESSNFSIL